MIMKEYSILHRLPELEPHRQMEFNILPRAPARDTADKAWEIEEKIIAGKKGFVCLSNGM